MGRRRVKRPAVRSPEIVPIVCRLLPSKVSWIGIAVVLLITVAGCTQEVVRGFLEKTAGECVDVPTSQPPRGPTIHFCHPLGTRFEVTGVRTDGGVIQVSIRGPNQPLGNVWFAKDDLARVGRMTLERRTEPSEIAGIFGAGLSLAGAIVQFVLGLIFLLVVLVAWLAFSGSASSGGSYGSGGGYAGGGGRGSESRPVQQGASSTETRNPIFTAGGIRPDFVGPGSSLIRGNETVGHLDKAMIGDGIEIRGPGGIPAGQITRAPFGNDQIITNEKNIPIGRITANLTGQRVIVDKDGNERKIREDFGGNTEIVD